MKFLSLVLGCVVSVSAFGQTLEGLWSTACIVPTAPPEGPVPRPFREKIQFQGNRYAYTWTGYNDPSCLDVSLAQPPNEGTFEVGGEATEVPGTRYLYLTPNASSRTHTQIFKFDEDGRLVMGAYGLKPDGSVETVPTHLGFPYARIHVR